MEMNKTEIIKTHFAVIDSTQVYARENLAMVQQDVLHQITADEQTGGIGQGGRKWHSPKNANLYVTYMITFTENDLANKLQLSQLSALSICQLLQEFDFLAEIKWKNDILVKGKKVSGTLVEVFDHPTHPQLKVVLFGIGININMGEQEFKSIDQPTTSMKLLANSAQSFKVNAVLDKLTGIITKNIHLYKTSGFGIFIPQLQERCAFKGEHIKVSEVDGMRTVSGKCVGLDASAHLIVMLAEGQSIILQTGRIVREYKNNTEALIEMRFAQIRRGEGYDPLIQSTETDSLKEQLFCSDM